MGEREGKGREGKTRITKNLNFQFYLISTDLNLSCHIWFTAFDNATLKPHNYLTKGILLIQSDMGESAEAFSGYTYLSRTLTEEESLTISRVIC